MFWTVAIVLMAIMFTLKLLGLIHVGWLIVFAPLIVVLLLGALAMLAVLKFGEYLGVRNRT